MAKQNFRERTPTHSMVYLLLTPAAANHTHHAMGPKPSESSDP